METKKCPLCREDILEDAIKCKHCGSMLNGIKKEGNLWLPVLSLVFGCLFIIGIFKRGMPEYAMMGNAVLSFIPLILGLISVSTQTKGKEMAIAGIALAGFTILVSFMG